MLVDFLVGGWKGIGWEVGVVMGIFGVEELLAVLVSGWGSAELWFGEANGGSKLISKRERE